MGVLLREAMSIRIETQARRKNVVMTRQRQLIISVLEASDDHPDVVTLSDRCQALDGSISISTVYRMLNKFVDLGLVVRHDFEPGKSARYEIAPESDHHDHLINVATGEVLEFQDERLEAITQEIAQRLGYKLTTHKLQLFGVPAEKMLE